MIIPPFLNLSFQNKVSFKRYSNYTGVPYGRQSFQKMYNLKTCRFKFEIIEKKVFDGFLILNDIGKDATMMRQKEVSIMKAKKEKGKLTPKKLAIILVIEAICIFVPPLIMCQIVFGNFEEYKYMAMLWILVPIWIAPHFTIFKFR
jgi:hypothetical protein